MTISSTTSSVTYAGSGTTGPFAYTFRILVATDLRVTKTVDATGVVTTLTNVTDYTVTGVGNATGGTVTLVAVVATGTTLTIRRVLPLTQPTSIQNQGDYFAKTHETQFDRSLMIDQQQQYEIDRFSGLQSVALSRVIDIETLTSSTTHINVARFAGTYLSDKMAAAITTVKSGTYLTGPITLDCRYVTGAFQVLNTDVLLNNIFWAEPSRVNVIFGPYELRLAAEQSTLAHTHWIFQGTTAIKKTAAGARLTGQMGFRTRLVGGLGGGTTVSCTSGSNTVTINDSSGSAVGKQFAIWGHLGRGGRDNGTITGAHTNAVATITVSAAIYGALATTGWVRTSTNEVIAFTGKGGGNTLTGCTRGYGGTTATAYVGGEAVDRAVYETFIITAVAGSVLTLDENVGITATAMDVITGIYDFGFHGHGVIDGNKDSAVDDTLNPLGYYGNGARDGYFSPELTWQNWDHGGINLSMSSDCQVNGTFRDNARPSAGLGADVWMFQNCKRNSGTLRFDGVGNIGLVIDDRTVAGSPLQEDNDSDDNVFVIPSVRGRVQGVSLDGGGNRNRVYVESAVGYTSTVFRLGGGFTQWVTAPPAADNVIELGTFKRGTGATSEVAVISGWTTGGNKVVTHTPGAVITGWPLAASGAKANTVDLPKGRATLAYSATIATDASLGDLFHITVTSAVAFTISNPTNLVAGARYAWTIYNNSGGAHGTITWGATFVTAAAPVIANAARATFTFEYDGTNLVQIAQLTTSAAAVDTVLNKTTTYTITAADCATGQCTVTGDTTAGGFTLTLPAVASVATGTRITAIKTNATGTLVLDPAGAETIRGNATEGLNAIWATMTIVNGGARWENVGSTA